jgi:hypothetical protein
MAKAYENKRISLVIKADLLKCVKRFATCKQSGILCYFNLPKKLHILHTLICMSNEVNKSIKFEKVQCWYY